MQLVAEAGSTKTAWGLLHEGAVQQLAPSAGINPNVLPPERIRELLASEVLCQLEAERVERVAFYGPALSSPFQAKLLEDILQDCFPKAAVFVGHDLLAAAQATLGSAPGVVGILGTGSNAGLYDGNQIVRVNGGLGYLLGDEGSGFALGRRLLRAALYQRLPEDLQRALAVFVGMPLHNYRHAVYTHERPNAELARLAGFAAQHRERPEIQALITLELEQFILVCMRPLLDGHSEVHLVGGIAGEFEPELNALTAKHGLVIRTLLPAPLDALLAYHLRHA